MQEISVIILKNLVILPNQEIKVELKSEISQKIIKDACKTDNSLVLVVAPIGETTDLPKIGVVAAIKSKIELPNKSLRVNLKGLQRVIVDKYFNKGNAEILNAIISECRLPKFNELEVVAVRRKLLEALKKYIDSAPEISNSILVGAQTATSLEVLTDMITSFLPFDTPKKLEYMQNINAMNRANSLLKDINSELEIIKLEEKINERVSINIEDNQKEFLLREKLKEIRNELGDKSVREEDCERFRETLERIDLPDKTKEKLANEITKLEGISDASPEGSVVRNYLDLVLNLPWSESSEENTDIKDLKKSLDKTHYGLDEVKERVLEYVGIKKINAKAANPIICLVGPPGVGKTSIATSIAKSLNREFIKISVGGLNDSTELTGSRRTYLGASPGKIIQSIKKCGVNNPVILIDEVDKMVKDYKGDPAATLLEILDPVQNKAFVDNYVEEPFDLSKVFFILTANIESDIPITLLDRLEIINLNSYTGYEKVNIAKKYLLPNIYREYGIKKIDITDKQIETIITNYTYESGVRDLDRVLRKVIRKVIIDNLEEIDLKQILGEEKYETAKLEQNPYPGVSNALAYTPMGGIVTKIETVKLPGSGKITITGMPGKSLEESVSVALDFLKTNYSINLNNQDIHIHFLDATTPKDGPSAGAAIAIAIMSLYLDKPIPANVAFTGEISLKGNILKVGGVKEKVIGAINTGVTTIYIPKDNETDIQSIPKKMLKNINVIGVKDYSEIYKEVFR